MVKKPIHLMIITFALLLLVSCSNTNAAAYSDEYDDLQNDDYVADGCNILEQLAALGFTEEHHDSTIYRNRSLEWILNRINARADYFTALAADAHNQVVQMGEVEVSRTGISFMLENRSDTRFYYLPEAWYLALYKEGRWIPVIQSPGIIWGQTLIPFSLQGGGIQQYHITWERRYGELAPGRYMYFREGWLGEYRRNQDSVYALFEFVITTDCPRYLPQAPYEESHDFIRLVEYRDVTPYSMVLVVENISEYVIDVMASIEHIIPNEYVEPSDLHELWGNQHHVPYLPIENRGDHLMRSEDFLPSGGKYELLIDWTKIFGGLPSDEYVIVVHFMGHAHPPHPTGDWDIRNPLIISFGVQCY